MAHQHEFMIIFRTEGTEEQAKQLLARTEALMKKEGGTIMASEPWGRRRLAFPIKKQRDGLYHLFRVQTEPAAIARLARAFRLEEAILRVLIVRAEAQPPASAVAAPPGATAAAPAAGRDEWSR